MNMKKQFPITPLLLSIGLSGCTQLTPEFDKADLQLPESWYAESEGSVTTAANDHATWWLNFNDPALTRLIDEAYNNNQLLQIAGLRVYGARASLARTSALRFPQVQTLRAGAADIKLSESGEILASLPDGLIDSLDTSFSNYGVSFNAAWELDFWGRIKSGIDASDARFEATVADYDSVLVTLSGDVGRSYILLRTLEERLVVAKKNVNTQERSLEIAQVRFKSGLTTELDVQQAKSLLYNTQSTIPLLNTLIRRTRNAISILIGRAPGTLDEILGETSGIPSADTTIAADVPSALLRRRPDIRRAELLASAQASLVGVRKADMYPAFHLVGSIGSVADSSGDLFESASRTSVAGFGMMWKFLNYGRLRNNVRIQDARFQQSINGYQLAVLNAAREVEDSLVAFTGAKTETVLKEQSAIAAERAVELAMTLYRDGVTNYTTVINTQRIQFLQQGAYISAKGDAAMKLIGAYKALGGGWQRRVDRPFVNSENLSEMQERTNWGDLLE